jgi:hypothetical protein
VPSRSVCWQPSCGWRSVVFAEVVITVPALVTAVTVGVRSTRRPQGNGSERSVAPRLDYRVTWDPSAHVLKSTPGPLVYIVREWTDDGIPQGTVKIGYTGVTRKAAAHGRIDDWETGTEYPVRVEGLIPGGPESLEKALHRALSSVRTSKRREWFRAERDDQTWRQIVESTAALHQEAA